MDCDSVELDEMLYVVCTLHDFCWALLFRSASRGPRRYWIPILDTGVCVGWLAYPLPPYVGLGYGVHPLVRIALYVVSRGYGYACFLGLLFMMSRYIVHSRRT